MNNSNFLKQNELLNFIRNTQAKSSEQGVKIKCFYITEDMKEFFEERNLYRFTKDSEVVFGKYELTFCSITIE